MIITIGREFGSGGTETGKLLAGHYGIPFFDSEALMDAAQRLGDFDEVRSFLLEEPVNSLIYAIAVSECIEKRAALPFAMIRRIADEQDCVLMGRCGNYIFRKNPRLTSVFLRADIGLRTERIAGKFQMSRQKARRLIEKTDKHRSDFHGYYTNEEWGRASNYQLCIDSGSLGIRQTAGLIIDFIDRKRNAEEL